MKPKILIVCLLLIFFQRHCQAANQIYDSEVSDNFLFYAENDPRLWLNPFNGVYKSNDAGTTWEQSGLKGAGIYDLEFNNQTKTLFAAGYYVEYGIGGLYKSSDYGNTWTHIGGNFSTRRVSSAGQNVYLGTFSHGFWVSNDNGSTFTQKLGDGFYGPQINAIDSEDAKVAFADSSNSYYSTDSGKTFQAIPQLANKSVKELILDGNCIIALLQGSTTILNTCSGTTNLPTRLFSLKKYGSKIYALKETEPNNFTLVYSTDQTATWIQSTTKFDLAGFPPTSLSIYYAGKLKASATTAGTGFFTQPIQETSTDNPIFEIPFIFQNKNELITTITSYFDHRYPLLGYTTEPTLFSVTTMIYDGTELEIPHLYYSSHDGVDFAISYGTEVKAVAAGTATYYWCNECGNTIKINHHNGYTSIYMHLQKYSLIANNTEVTTGQTIGKVGMTGNTTGPHLHFAIQNSSKYPDNKVDPFGWEGLFQDPWPNYAWNDATGTHTGSVSQNLWIPKPDRPEAFINLATQLSLPQINVSTSNQNLNIQLKPRESPKNIPANLYPIPNYSFEISSRDLFKTTQTQLNNLSISFSAPQLKSEISNLLNLSSLQFFAYESAWVPLVNAQINKPAWISLFAEKRALPPIATSAQLIAPKTLQISANTPNADIYYSIGDQINWEQYKAPISTDQNIIYYKSISPLGDISPIQTFIPPQTKNGLKDRIIFKSAKIKTAQTF